MEQPKGLMQFSAGRIKSLAITPNEKKEPTASLTLSGDLTPDLAAMMRCRDAVFRDDGKPHPNVKRLDLEGILRDCMLSLPGADSSYNTFYPEDIASFRVEVDGMIVRLNMLVRVKGRHLELVDFLEKTNTDAFDFAVRSRQESFDFSGKVSGTQAAPGGDKAGNAEKSGPLFSGVECVAEKANCLFCERGVPKNDQGRHITGEELVECDADAKREPAIPDAREMGQRRERRQRTRAEMNQPTPEQVQAETEAVEVVQ